MLIGTPIANTRRIVPLRVPHVLGRICLFHDLRPQKMRGSLRFARNTTAFRATTTVLHHPRSSPTLNIARFVRCPLLYRPRFVCTSTPNINRTRRRSTRNPPTSPGCVAQSSDIRTRSSHTTPTVTRRRSTRQVLSRATQLCHTQHRYPNPSDDCPPYCLSRERSVPTNVRVSM